MPTPTPRDTTESASGFCPARPHEHPDGAPPGTWDRPRMPSPRHTEPGSLPMTAERLSSMRELHARFTVGIHVPLLPD